MANAAPRLAPCSPRLGSATAEAPVAPVFGLVMQATPVSDPGTKPSSSAAEERLLWASQATPRRPAAAGSSRPATKGTDVYATRDRIRRHTETHAPWQAETHAPAGQ